ncbi:MAG: hypothetical protein KBT47_06605 [Armatimonadetes bacterium]|nr:hypothetical protein [Candidatus Hippobium faecium]
MDKKLVESIWEEVSELVKDDVINPSVFNALEHAVPIDFQDGKFILGFAAQDTPLIGYVTSASTLPLINRCLTDNMKMPVELMVVEGTSMEEYLAHKELMESARKTVNAAQEERKAKRKIENTWEEVGDKCIRSFTNMDNKGFAINKAMYLRKAFQIIYDHCKEIDYVYQKDPLHDRCLSRLFDRVETAVELPAGTIAYLFFQSIGVLDDIK